MRFALCEEEGRKSGSYFWLTEVFGSIVARGSYHRSNIVDVPVSDRPIASLHIRLC